MLQVLVSIQAFVVSLLAPGSSPVLLSRTNTRLSPRAVTMLEWVLIATVAVILFALLRTQLRDTFSDLITRIRDAVTAN